MRQQIYFFGLVGVVCLHTYIKIQTYILNSYTIPTSQARYIDDDRPKAKFT